MKGDTTMKVTVMKREDLGTGASARYRREEKIPGVIYGKGRETVPVLLNEREIEEVIRTLGRQAIFDIETPDGKTQQVFIKEVQKESLRDHLLHVSLQTIQAGQKITVEVPIILENTEEVKRGILDQPLYEVTIEATPSNVPTEFTLDVGELEIGDALNVSDLKSAEGVTIIDEPDTLIAQVLPPAAEEPTEPTDASEGEPGLVGDEQPGAETNL